MKGNKEYFVRAISAKKEFKTQGMKRDVKLVGARIEYIRYFLEVWLPKNDPEIKISQAVKELSNYHLFISEKRIYELLKQNFTHPIGIGMQKASPLSKAGVI